MKPDSSKTRWERRKEARPQELLAAALDAFVESGYAATRLEDVARRAGVSKGTLYLYFASKEELFKAVVRENLLPMIGEAEQEFAKYQGASVDLLREFILGWWEKIGNTKLSGISKLMLSEAGIFPEIAHFYHTEIVTRGTGMLKRLIERGIERGEFRGIDPTMATQVLIAPMLMLMQWKHFYPACGVEPLSPQDYLDSFIDIYLNGLLSKRPNGKQQNFE